MRKKQGTYSRILAGILAFVFTLNSILPNASAGQILFEARKQSELPDMANIWLPPELGHVTSAFRGQSGRMLFHLEDAHGNYEAQIRLVELIDFLNKHYGVKQVYLEGATQKINPNLYRFFEEKKPAFQAGRKLLEMGELTGAEIFLLKQELLQNCGRLCVQAEGIESASLSVLPQYRGAF